MAAPLLNPDKISFVRSRIISTLTGWNTDYNILLQALFLLLPWMAGILELFSPIDFKNIHPIWIGACATVKLTLLSTEFGKSWRVVLSSVLCGVFQVLSMVYLSFASFAMSNYGLKVILYCLCWISVGIAQLVLIRGHVDEPNTYYPEKNEWDCTTRALYLTVILACFAFEYSVGNEYLRIAIAFFPLVSVSGILPRFDIFLEYLLEVICNVLLGIGPHQTFKRSVIDFFLTGITLVLFSLVQAYSEEFHAIVFLGLMAVFLSSSSILDFLSGKKVVFSMVSLGSMVLRIVISGVLMWFSGSLESIISVTSLVLVSLIQIISEIQQEWIPSFLPLFHNPITKCKRHVDLKFVNSICTYLAPIFISSWITGSYHYTDPNYGRYVSATIVGIFYIRALRYTWQNLRMMALDIYIICIWMYFSKLNFGYQTINPPILFVISFLRQVIFRFLSKMWFWGLSLIHYLTSKKHVLKRWYLYLIPAIIISPISIAISAFLNAPVMPLLGLPIFWMGFLRPKRMWPNIEVTCSVGPEAKIYESLCPSLLKSISKSIANGRIIQMEPGTVLLARFESRIIMIKCLESSYEDAKVMVIGSELEPTSCHSLEGTALDSVLDNCFGASGRTEILNRHFFHSVLPVDEVVAEGYSESNIVTTGILDTKENLSLIPIIYFKVLVHHLITDIDYSSIDLFKNPPIHSTILANCWKKFPMKWFEYLHMHSKTSSIGAKNMDQDLMMIATASYAITLGIVSASDISISLNSIFELYRGDLPLSTQMDVKNWFLNPHRKKLREICLRSFRSSIKLVIDQAVDGEPQSLGDLMHILDNYAQNWFITINSHQVGKYDVWSGPESWKAALHTGIPNLFLLSRKEDDVISIRILAKQPCVVRIARINSESVMGIWSNLVMEILYITSDDDERYSIQAHETLLRNIVSQLANPPFGYPIWTSQRIIRYDNNNLYSHKRVSPNNSSW